MDDRPTFKVPWGAALIFLAVSCWSGWNITLNNDVSWQYWVARQIRGGAILYRDIFEVNPPLWFWGAIPASALSDWLHVDPRHLAIVLMMARVTLALVLVAKLLEHTPPRQACLSLAGLALLIALLPLHDFAEREHIMLIGAVPYTIMSARRREIAARMSPWLAACVGGYAAYGFAMKPHFMLVPLALELWLALALRRAWRPLRPETIALIVVTAVYLAAILLLAPDYLRVMVPLARAAYGAFSPPFAWLLLRQLWTPTWLLALVALAVARHRLPSDAQAAIVAAAALAIVYFVQGKGFGYHALPVTAMLGWAVWALLVRNDDVVRNMVRHPLAVLTLMLLIATASLLGAFTPARAGRATAAIERLPAGSVVAIVSAHSWLAFPLVEDRRFVWPMRTMNLWSIPKIAREGDGATATANGLRVRRQTLDMIATDLWCHPPDAILFDDPAGSPALVGLRFSYEAFVRSDLRLRDLLASYRRSLSDSGTTLYIRSAPVAPRGSACHPIRIRPNLA